MNDQSSQLFRMKDPLLDSSYKYVDEEASGGARPPTCHLDTKPSLYRSVVVPATAIVLWLWSVLSLFVPEPDECLSDGDCYVGFGCAAGRCDCTDRTVPHRWKCDPAAPYSDAWRHRESLFFILVAVVGGVALSRYHELKRAAD